MTSALFNIPPAETQLQRRHQLVYCEAANASTKNMTLDAKLKVVNKMGSSKNQKQPAIGREYIHTEVDSHQLNI